MKKKLLPVLLAVAIVLAAGTVVQLWRVNQYRKIVATVSVDGVDLTQVADGEYVGSFDALLVAAKVRVTVSDNRIINIELVEHKNDRGGAAEVILERILSAQSLKVDIVTGATNSSKVILQAIKNALQGIPVKE